MKWKNLNVRKKSVSGKYLEQPSALPGQTGYPAILPQTIGWILSQACVNQSSGF